LGVVGVDHRQRDGDLLARGRRQRQARQPGARLGGQQAAVGRGAVVIEHGLHALLPLAALIDQRVAQPDAGAQIEQVLGRDPRFGQPADHQQLAQVARVGAIALGALLGPAPRGGLGRLGQMDARADRAELLDDEPPARRRLQRHLKLLAAKARGEPSHARAIGRRDAAARDLAGRGVDPLGGDLRSMLIQSHYDRHSGASSSSTV
jgi:hypothetical protein